MQVAARVLGNDAAMAFCGAAGSQFQLNIMMPVMGHMTLESVRLLSGAVLAFTRRCLVGMTANVETCNGEVERSPAMATGLNAYIGYEQAAKLAKESITTGKTVRELCREKKILSEEMLEKALDPWKMTQPG
jgi:fumarate hydratase class II